MISKFNNVDLDNSQIKIPQGIDGLIPDQIHIKSNFKNNSSIFNKNNALPDDFGNSLRDNYLQKQIDKDVASSLEETTEENKAVLLLKSKEGNVLSKLNLHIGDISVLSTLEEIDNFLIEANLGRIFIYAGEDGLENKYFTGSSYMVTEEDISL